jgi:hypothetical protein
LDCGVACCLHTLDLSKLHAGHRCVLLNANFAAPNDIFAGTRRNNRDEPTVTKLELEIMEVFDDVQDAKRTLTRLADAGSELAEDARHVS